jgi:hypothetical protein
MPSPTFDQYRDVGFRRSTEHLPTRVNALLDVIRGLDEDDLDEVITYALFRRTHQSRLKK